jgi:hypothetical protein
LGKTPSAEINEARKACVDYTEAALKVMATIVGKDEKRKFRFVYLSGAASERDQAKSLWFAQDYRRMRVCSTHSSLTDILRSFKLLTICQGQVENLILAHAKEHEGAMEAVIMRPGFVLAREQSIRDTIRGMGPSVKVDILARALISSAMNGSKTQLVENIGIKELGA